MVDYPSTSAPAYKPSGFIYETTIWYFDPNTSLLSIQWQNAGAGPPVPLNAYAVFVNGMFATFFFTANLAGLPPDYNYAGPLEISFTRTG
ncbi:hypothetical protein FRB99_001085 [Tulasnella sp. 403]|nr:hypothetical protein FRB99_001085 [Tulasnella sp. 403]